MENYESPQKKVEEKGRIDPISVLEIDGAESKKAQGLGTQFSFPFFYY